jgi:hypothetical protein
VQYGRLYESIFTDWSRLKSPFQNRTWEQVLIAGEAMKFDDEHFNAFGAACASVGDRTVFVTISDSIPPHLVSVVIPWERGVVSDAHRDTDIFLFHYAIFGELANWGAMSYHDEFTRVAGEPLFMDAFANALGGREAVKRRFYDYAASRWQAPGDVQRQILASVGWDAPSSD